MRRIEVTGASMVFAPRPKMPVVPWPTWTNSRGSWIQFAPALSSWPNPPRRVVLHEISSRNCHLVCCVPWSATVLVPVVTPFGKRRCGPMFVGGISLTKREYCTTSSFRLAPPISQLWLALIEWYVLLLVAQDDRAARRPAPAGCELPSRP